MGGGLFTDSFILGAKGQARGSSGIVSLFSLIDFIQDRVVIEKQGANWLKSLTPQLQSLQAGDGAFFFTPALQSTALTTTNSQSRNQTPEQKGATKAFEPPYGFDLEAGHISGSNLSTNYLSKMAPESAIAACAIACNSTAYCRAFTVGLDSSTCSLYRSIAEIIPSNSYLTGRKKY